jgi:putative transport protein
MTNWLTDLFLHNSIAHAILILSLTIAIGLWLGRLKIGGISLGVTWVLFIGMLLSYFHFEIDEEVNHFTKEFGLILFVYSIGLQVAPGFFSSLKKEALGNNLLASSVVLLGTALTVILFILSKQSITVMAGVMSGAVTNTPGLAAAQAAANDIHISGVDKSLITLAYAVSYPIGVFGIILSLLLLKKILGVRIDHEQEMHRKLDALRSARPVSAHFSLENPRLFNKPLHFLFSLLKEKVIVSRMLHHGTVITPTPETVLAAGDVLLVVASKKELQNLEAIVGRPSLLNLKTAAESDLVSVYLTVTNKAVTHKRLGDIAAFQQHDFTITRLKRAGVEMVPHGGIFLQLGDTLKVVGTREGVQHIEAAVGNTVKKLELPDLAPIFFGMVLGILLGSLPFQFPGMPVPVKIGLAGGPLIVALLLSRFGNVFYLNNYATYSANLWMRELGISLFLASVGLSSGKNLSIAFGTGDGLAWMGMAAIITCIPLLIVGWIAHRFFRKTYFEICGLLSGASTDPPALAFATKMAGNDVPSVSYATVYPLTMILRIVSAQLLILLLSS